MLFLSSGDEEGLKLLVCGWPIKVRSADPSFVAGDPVDHDIRSEMFQTVNDKVQILVPFISAEKTGFMISGKICTTQYMKKLQLDPWISMAFR